MTHPSATNTLTQVSKARLSDAEALDLRADFCLQLIRQAGDVALDGFARQVQGQAAGQAGQPLATKGPQDFLTETDLAVEEFIRAQVAEAFPADGFFGEETGQVAGEAIWIVDPIDGTANFARAIPHYCIAIALVLRGQLEFGAIYAPSTDEIYWARRGAGAYRNQTRLNVAATQDVAQATYELGWSNRHSNQAYLDILAQLLDGGVNVRRAASGALALAYVADGRSDGYAELDMNAWDCLAGLLMVAEAGGIVGGTALSGDLTSGGSVLAVAPGVSDLLIRASGIAPQDA